MTRIYIFPGQGSQTLGMGGDLFDRFPEQLRIADEELGYSVKDLCLAGPGDRLRQTQFTQPVLFVVSAFSFLNLLVKTGELPHFVAGHSLGEYNALFAAGVFDFRTGVRVVRQRAKLMAKASGGGMTAVIGLTQDQIRETLSGAGLHSIDIANLNSPKQTVISGPENDLALSETRLEQAGAMLVKRLPVSAAFHSRYMKEAEQTFGLFLDSVEFARPRIPVFSNVTARLHEPTEMKEMLTRQITQPVRWCDIIQSLIKEPEPKFTEAGPGNVLTGLLRQIEKENFTAVVAR
jgi:malonyl CoA-acyl carrier protein transacylase